MATPCPYGHVRLSVVGFGVPVPQLVPGHFSRCLGCCYRVGVVRYTPGCELWAWRSYQVWIDLRCARLSNVECGVRSAECGMLVDGTRYSKF